jgi:hypothetical protein
MRYRALDHFNGSLRLNESISSVLSVILGELLRDPSAVFDLPITHSQKLGEVFVALIHRHPLPFGAASQVLPKAVFWEAAGFQRCKKCPVFLVSAPGLEPGTT